MPAVIDTGGKPGDDVRVSFQLTNNADSVLPIHMHTRDSPARNGQPAGLIKSLSAEDWIIFTQADFILQAKQTRSVEATLYIPDDASPGGHYADLVVQPLSLEDEFLATQSEIAVQMLVSVAGDIREKLYIGLNGPSTIIVQRSEAKNLVFEIENNGNIHSLTSSRLDINRGGSNVGSVESQPIIILPGEIKETSFRLPETLSAGLYTAQASATYGVSQSNATSLDMRIIVLPFDLKLLIIIPLLLIGILVFRIRSRVRAAIKAVTKGELPESKK